MMRFDLRAFGPHSYPLSTQHHNLQLGHSDPTTRRLQAIGVLKGSYQCAHANC